VPVSNPRASATLPITPPPILARALAACPAGLAIGLPVYGFALVVKSIHKWRKPAHKGPKLTHGPFPLKLEQRGGPFCATLPS
jgi:hypothetical protein